MTVVASERSWAASRSRVALPALRVSEAVSTAAAPGSTVALPASRVIARSRATSVGRATRQASASSKGQTTVRRPGSERTASRSAPASISGGRSAGAVPETVQPDPGSPSTTSSPQLSSSSTVARDPAKVPDRLGKGGPSGRPQAPPMRPTSIPAEARPPSSAPKVAATRSPPRAARGVLRRTRESPQPMRRSGQSSHQRRSAGRRPERMARGTRPRTMKKTPQPRRWRSRRIRAGSPFGVERLGRRVRWTRGHHRRSRVGPQVGCRPC